MQFRSILSLAVLALTPSVLAQTPANPFNMTYIFTAHLNIGNAYKPINVTGGVRLIEPILNGTVTGPILNGTIDYSIATPTVIQNMTIQVPTINVVGTTSDGYPFYIYETGIGAPSTQVTRIQLEVGSAKYAALQYGYILASVVASSDRKSVTVEGYLVSNADA